MVDIPPAGFVIAEFGFETRKNVFSTQKHPCGYSTCSACCPEGQAVQGMRSPPSLRRGGSNSACPNSCTRYTGQACPCNPAEALPCMTPAYNQCSHQVAVLVTQSQTANQIDCRPPVLLPGTLALPLRIAQAPETAPPSRGCAPKW